MNDIDLTQSSMWYLNGFIQNCMKKECNLIIEDDLTPIQKANMGLSLAWKYGSCKLINQALKEENDEHLLDAILWCEKKGHATRYLLEDEKKLIGETIRTWLKDNWKSRIKFKCLPKEIDSRSYSWVSKICHIMNPIDNPLIYDSKTRKHLNAYNYEKWLKTCEAFVSRYKTEKGELITIEEIYKFDSVIWAFYS